MEKTKLLLMTDHNTFTGFGNVSDGIARGWVQEGYEVYWLGWGFHAMGPMPRDGYVLLPSGNDPFGSDVLPVYINQIKPEILMTQSDSRMLMYMPDLLPRIQNKPTWIFYVVIDGNTWDVEGKNTVWPSNWARLIKTADKVVAMTKYGQNILKANGIESEMIYHGIDTSIFKPISEENKKQIKRNVGLGEDKFVFGGMFKNMQRKNPEKFLQAFRILLNSKNIPEPEKEKLVLLLHTQPSPGPAGEFDLVQQSIDYGLQPGKNVIFSNMAVPQVVLPNVFNTMDVFIHLGTMEGFGLPIIEAMSCGLPVIGVDSCTMPELIGDCGLISKVPSFDKQGKHKISFGSYNGVECDMVNPWDVADKMEKLYLEPKLRSDLGFKATEKSLREFDWRIINHKWNELLKSLIITEANIPAEWAKLYQETKV